MFRASIVYVECYIPCCCCGDMAFVSSTVIEERLYLFVVDCDLLLPIFSACGAREVVLVTRGAYARKPGFSGVDASSRKW